LLPIPRFWPVLPLEKYPGNPMKTGVSGISRFILRPVKQISKPLYSRFLKENLAKTPCRGLQKCYHGNWLYYSHTLSQKENTMATKKKAKTAAKKKTTTSSKKTKSAAKTTTAKALGPIRTTLTKSALLTLVAEQNNISRKQAGEVLTTIESVILGSVHPKGAGQFVFPGLMKVTLRKVPARKAGTLVRNPATGEMVKAAAKPASVRVKIRPLSKLKAAAAA
jgi:nucleoid DNA-binding protein